MRLRNKPWAKDKLAKHSNIVIDDPEQHKEHWNKYFENENPIYIEVGTGKGRFVKEMAKQHPDVNFIGVELQPSIIVGALDLILEDQPPNVRLLNQNAEDLPLFFEKGEVSRVYLNFSDPWPKNRHEKRRLTYESFLAIFQSILPEKGEIHFKTDNQGLFEYSLHSFSKYGMILNNVSLDLHNSDFEGNVMTEYEEKFSNKGNRIYRCEAAFRS
jgi:tRNA (guanine-N7-)-methyltransferase